MGKLTSIRLTRLILVAALAASSYSAEAGSPESYFPASLRVPQNIQCKGWPKPQPVVMDIEAEWYSKHWAAAGEASLFAASERPARSAAKSYRFTWLRSFHAPMIVRVDRKASGELRLTAKRLSGKGGYEPGRIEAKVERVLDRNERRDFNRALARANDLVLPPKLCTSGYDGAMWIMETAEPGAYRYINRWSPKTGAVRDLGLVMLRFTGWGLSPLY